LIQECRKQGLEYGYYFVDVTGGFKQTSRFNLMLLTSPLLTFIEYI
jgi:hypothetical protein